MKKYKQKLIDPLKLIRMWKEIKSNPNRVYLKTDLSRKLGLAPNLISKFSHTLLKMELIERVDAQYLCGKRWSVRKKSIAIRKVQHD